jgi:4'-phosphopantetheinyl transferase
MTLMAPQSAWPCLRSAGWFGVAEAVPNAYAISDGEVHVWLTSLGWLSGQAEALAQILSDDERQKADRFHFPADRQCHIIGRALVRIFLAHLLERQPADFRFRYNEFGKPYLADNPDERDLHFNISHSGDFIAIALAARRHIGIDVECIREDLALEQLVLRFFSPREQADWGTLPAHQKRDAFFRCWTRKEAYIKARGMGLSMPLHQFDVSLRPGEPPMLLATRPDPAERTRWVIQDLCFGPLHMAAVAVEGSNCQLRMMEWSPPCTR